MNWQEKLLNIEPINLLEIEGIPHFGMMQDTEQEPEWHAEGNVLIHANMAVAEAYKICKTALKHDISQQRALYIGTMLHDIGKIDSTFRNEKTGKIVAYGHEFSGVKFAKEFLEQHFGNKISEALRDQILSLIEYHGHPKRLVKNCSRDRRYLQLSCEVDTELVYYLEVADFKGRQGSSCDEVLAFLEEFKKKCQTLEVWGKKFSADDKLNQWSKLFGGLRKDVTKKDHEFVFTIGAPASGKTTYLKKHYSEYEFVSMDEERLKLCGTMADMSKNIEVYNNCFKELSKKLKANKSSVWDATSLTRKIRRRLVQLARNTGATVTLIHFDLPLTELLHRNKQRERHVPEDVITRFYDNLQPPKDYEYDHLKTITQ